MLVACSDLGLCSAGSCLLSHLFYCGSQRKVDISEMCTERIAPGPHKVKPWACSATFTLSPEFRRFQDDNSVNSAYLPEAVGLRCLKSTQECSSSPLDCGLGRPRTLTWHNMEFFSLPLSRPQYLFIAKLESWASMHENIATSFVWAVW